MARSVLCECGRLKDYRAARCSRCAGVSYSVNREHEDTHEEILSAIASSLSVLEASSKLKQSRNTLSKFIRSNDVDISHFRAATNRVTPDEQIFCMGSKRNNGTVKKRILDRDLISYVCALCGQLPFWNDQELVLELDHEDGNPFNNCLDNLRFLCPNCHSQTPTNKGKRGKRGSKS